MKIDIALHISRLLYNHGRVVVPNLGGFCAKYKEASTDKYGHISPPTKELYFDESLNFEDNILVEDIVQTYGISYAEAIGEVAGFASDVKNNLTNKTVVIADVGRLYLDNRNDIVLVPSSVNFLENAFGLPKMEYYPLSRTIEKEAILPAIEPVKPTKINRVKTFFVNIWSDPSSRAVVIIVLLLFLVVPQLSRLANPKAEYINPTIIENEVDLLDKNKPFKPFEETVEAENEVDETTKIQISTPETTDEVSKDEQTRNVNVKPTKATETTTAPTTQPKVTPIPPKSVTPAPKPTTTKSKDYIISIGNFTTEANAKVAIDQVKKAGYVAYVKELSPSKIRVGVSINCKTDEVDTKLATIKALFPDAWVMNR